MSEPKPRDLWIQLDSLDGRCVYDEPYTFAPNTRVHFIEFSAYQKAIEALKRECCCTGETSHIAPHKKILCDACETLRELGEIE